MNLNCVLIVDGLHRSSRFLIYLWAYLFYFRFLLYISKMLNLLYALKTVTGAVLGDNTMYPHVAQYAPYKVEGLEKGEMKSWCACGLSKNQVCYLLRSFVSFEI